MNQQENSVMLQIEKDIAEIKTALLGSALSGDEGLVGKMKAFNLRQDMQEKRMDSLIESKIKNDVYMKIIIWLASIIGIGFVGLLFNYFNK
jgi:hypothetical protein